MRVVTTQQTYLKLSPKDAAQLPNTQKVVISRETRFEVEDAWQCDNNHYLCLNSGNVSFQNVQPRIYYIFKEHCEIIMPDTILKVPYYGQRDNSERWHGVGDRQCCLTSNAMLAAFKSPEFLQRARDEGYRQPENYYGYLLSKYGDTTDHNANTKVLEDLGIKSYWSTQLDVFTLRSQIQAGNPVVIGTKYKTSGHIVIVVGKRPDGYLVHDPYGTRYGATDSYTPQGGNFDFYSHSLMAQIFWDLGEKAGHGRILK